jgi:3-hydroxyisobutyrate dehydrogenase-like beta-hydroxyacid dehydrogenase
MGAAMVGTLRRAGFDVVVFNRTAARAEETASATGAGTAATPAAAVSDADVVISSLADDAAVEDVYNGPDGAASGLKSGTIVLEMSTIDPKTLTSIEPAISAAGATLLDAPVSGSVQLVEAGNLTVMVGGDAEALAVVEPVLEALSARIFHIGSLGAGATIKLAVNAIVHAINISVAEALVLAEMAGVDRSTAYEVFASSAAGAPFVAYKRAAFENPEEAAVAFSLDLVAKDLDLILGLAGDVGLEMGQGAANREVAGRAIAAGYGDSDMSAVAGYLREGGRSG